MLSLQKFLGNGGLYSVNYEYQSLNSIVARIGFSVQPEVVAIPITIGKLIGPSKDLFELGMELQSLLIMHQAMITVEQHYSLPEQ